MDGINSSNLVVIGATNRPNSIDPALRRPGRFDREIFIDPPNDIQRAAILKHSCRKLNIDIDFNEIGKLTNGFVGADLVFLSHLIGQIKIKQDNVSNQDVIDCIKKCSPSLQRNSMTTESFDLSWDDIGGVDQVKKKLLQIIEWPFKYAESFKRLGITSARGVLLYGPPGCSKTSLVKIIAKNSGATFFSLNGAQIYNAYLGESEKTIKDVFSRARLASPSIIFLDEIDAIVGKRGSTGGGVSERILSTLLNEMDGIEAMVGVLVVGATNRLDMVDDALKRPGRFDCIVQVPLPDLESRIKIFKVHTRGMKTVDVDFQELASETDGMSGAQIANICREAAMNALREDIKADHVTMSHFRMNGLEKKFKSLAI